MINILAYLILSATIIFNLYLNFPETQVLADPNDNIFQYSLVYRTNWIWENYGCPISFSCIPNLIDHNVTTWAEGYPLPFYYSHIPQIATVASYKLIITPLISQFLNFPISLYQYYNWTKYLLYTLLPLPVFLALRIIGFNPIISALGAFFFSHLSTDGLYGIDSPSFLWRGYGLTSQLYALFFLPLGIAFVYKSLAGGTREGLPKNAAPVRASEGMVMDGKDFISRATRSFLWDTRVTGPAVVFLTLTTAGHLGIGIIGILSTIPFLFFDLNLKNIWLRLKKLFFIFSILFFILSYWLIPILFSNQYHIISFWDPIWKFNSYGWYEVVRQFFQGEIFDWQRAPIVTSIVTIGFFALLTNNRNSNSHPELTDIVTLNSFQGLNGIPKQVRNDKKAAQHEKMQAFSALFAFWFLMYFGRTTWGGLIDLIPGMKDFHQHRFIVGIHIAALFLIPAGLEYILSLLRKIIFAFKHPKIPILKDTNSMPPIDRSFLGGDTWRDAFTWVKGEHRNQKEPGVSEKFGIEGANINLNIIFYILSLTFISVLAYFAAQKTIQYAQLNNRWIKEANNAYRYDEKNFNDLATYLNTLPPSRIYAGRPGNWGKNFRLGSTQLYMLLGVNGFDMSQFLPETWSPLSENEQNFDERVAEDYDLLNLKYIVADKNHDFALAAKLDKKFGPFELYQIPTTGWFDVVTSPMFVKTDKTNYINLVQLWHRSYARRWKMHPLISVDKNPEIPPGMQKILEMKDEVGYEETSPPSPLLVGEGQGEVKNIFSDYPFVFPEATVSAKIKEEKVEKQTYSATIDVPNNCKQCLIMFKMSYHPNWQVKVDGQPAAKFAVFPFYLATPTTAGSHTVEFTYRPNRLKVVLLLLEILVIGVLFILRRKGYLIKHLNKLIYLPYQNRFKIFNGRQVTFWQKFF